MAEESRSFQAEVSRLLHIVTNALYSEKEIFLRELISNASDACDRLRYLSITEPNLMEEDSELAITITVDPDARTLTISDNGIGMDRDELIDNLGTIARSGTQAFVERLTGDARKDVALIGQFGVGFYSAFIVADRVEVVSRRAGGAAAWRWTSTGSGEYSIADAEPRKRGTEIVLSLKKGEDEFLDRDRLRHIVKTYSDHIAIPIRFSGADETLNAASALWTRQGKDVTEEQYREFYHHVGHTFDDPWLTLHAHAEGKIEYRLLLFVPSTRPFDLFHPERRHRVKLYVKRIFITDDYDGLVPPYLRFLRGVIDSEDLALNISREMLQNSPIIARIRSAVTRRVLTALEKKADKDADSYATFWENFGAVLKEGIYEDAEQRDALLKLARFRSTTSGEGLVSLDAYVERMKPGQKAIYYISGDSRDALRRSPQLEGFAARNVEVLLLTDPVDEFWIPAVGTFSEKPFASVTRGAADLDALGEPESAPAEDADAPSESAVATLIVALKQALGDSIKDVQSSKRLTDSAVCLVADDSDLDMHLSRLLRQQGQIASTGPRVLEINPRHTLIKALAERAIQPGAVDALADAAHLLLDQARILEGEPLPDPSAFARRMADTMARGLPRPTD
jgi:molecular chaperone HtpG